MREPNDLAQDALNRMRRAFERGTGCRLTADMIHAMSVTIFGQMWSENDPRTTEQHAQPTPQQEER